MQNIWVGKMKKHFYAAGAAIAHVMIIESVAMAAPIAFINEFHYDNAMGDVNEFVEIAGSAGLDLTGWTVTFYNGSNGTEYRTEQLSGVLSDQSDGYGFSVVALPVNGIQNGQPDGLVLADANGVVVDSLAYEGSFTAVGGVADGVVLLDIGVAEDSSTPIDSSLGLTGTGGSTSDFVWALFDEPSNGMGATPGAANVGQTFSTLTGAEVPLPPAMGLFALAGVGLIKRTRNGE
ncbi:MAG: lamin tail domain-containing protein [Pseudomonadota bacterium]